MWFCEQRANRYAIAKSTWRKFWRQKRIWENDHVCTKGKQETWRCSWRMPLSPYSLASNHHHNNAVKFEDISDIIARSNSLRAINDTLTSRLSQLKETSKASEHEFALATFRARRLEVEQSSLRHCNRAGKRAYLLEGKVQQETR